MPDPIRLTGMPQAASHGDTNDIRFVLEVRDDNPIFCVADYGAASQIAAGLGQALFVLRMELAAKGSVVPISAEHLSKIHVDRDLLSGSLVMTVTTLLGVPFVFQIPTQAALEFADQLRTEALKEMPLGSA
jgi:hypothetical protein